MYAVHVSMYMSSVVHELFSHESDIGVNVYMDVYIQQTQERETNMTFGQQRCVLISVLIKCTAEPSVYIMRVCGCWKGTCY